MRVFDVGKWAVAAVAIGLIGFARPRVTRVAHAVEARSDVYALPPAEVLPTVSFGYRAALADLIWAHVLVAQGLRFSEGRPFEHVTLCLDAINALEPKFREPYRLTDSLVSFQRNDPNPDRSAHETKRILERGLRELPYDAQLWVNYGEYLAYIAPSMLKDQKETARWRIDGARALVHAGELGSKSETVLWHSVSAVGILSKEGEVDAMVRFLEQIYAMTEDSELREYVEKRLQALANDRREFARITLTQAMDAVWKETFPFVPRALLRLVGPPVNTWECAGPLSADHPREACARDWSSWVHWVSRSIR